MEKGPCGGWDDRSMNDMAPFVLVGTRNPSGIASIFRWKIPSANIYCNMQNKFSLATDFVCVRSTLAGFHWSIEPGHEKMCLSHMRTIKAQISLRIRAVWSAPFCCSLPRLYNIYSFYIRNLKPLGSLYSWAGRFESYLVENPEDTFSHDEVQIQATISRNGLPENKKKWAATRQNQQSGCAPSEDSDQPGHPSSLIRVFAVRSTGS